MRHFNYNKLTRAAWDLLKKKLICRKKIQKQQQHNWTQCIQWNKAGKV